MNNNHLKPALSINRKDICGPLLLLCVVAATLLFSGCADYNKALVIGWSSSRDNLNESNIVVSSINPKRDPAQFRLLQVTVDHVKVNNHDLTDDPDTLDLLAEANIGVLPKDQSIQYDTPSKISPIIEVPLRKLDDSLVKELEHLKKVTLEFDVTHLRAEIILDREKRSKGKFIRTDVAVDLDIILHYKCDLPVDRTEEEGQYILALRQSYIEALSVFVQHSAPLAKNDGRELFINEDIFVGESPQKIGEKVLGKNTVKPFLNSAKCVVQ